LELSGFQPTAVEAGSEWFKRFKEQGGKKVVFISKLSSARMVAATLGFAVRVPVTTFDRMDRAFDHLGIPPPARTAQRLRRVAAR
jgi:hypothetical protein